MLRHLALTLAPCLLLLTSCAPPAPDTAADLAALKTLDEQWSSVASRNDVDATVAFYADDAVLLPPNEPIATNKEAIRKSWAGLLGPDTKVSWKVTKAEVAKAGDIGYIYGTYTLDIKDVHDTGKLLEVWRKQPDGKWKCIVDTYNSDTPLPPAK